MRPTEAAYSDHQPEVAASPCGAESGAHKNKPRLLYLGTALPPGVAGLFPDLQPAGQAMETELIQALRTHFEIRSAGISPFNVAQFGVPPNGSPGIAHQVNLVEKPPELIHRWLSLRRLCRAYASWRAEGWTPEVVLALNLAPISNCFVNWLRRHKQRPRLVLLLSDSRRLGRRLPWFTRARHWCKPMAVPDEVMARRFDGCIALSRHTEQYFAPHGIPWLWMPGGCDPRRAIVSGNGSVLGPIRYGYFGCLAAHSGLLPFAQVLLARDPAATLDICGFGREAPGIASLCAANPRLRHHGFISRDDCLQFAQSVDVLVNSRPCSEGNQNSFPSKVFEYALSGRAILTTRLSGVDEVLGKEAYYFDENAFTPSLEAALDQLAATPREALRERGRRLRCRIVATFNWERQAARMAQFLREAWG